MILAESFLPGEGTVVTGLLRELFLCPDATKQDVPVLNVSSSLQGVPVATLLQSTLERNSVRPHSLKKWSKEALGKCTGRGGEGTS